MKTFIFMVISITFIIIINGCSNKDGSDYLPINDGSKYEYSIEYTTPFSGVQKGKMIVRTDGKEEINGKTYYKQIAVYSGLPGIESEINYFRKTVDGVYEISGKYKENGEFLSTPFPLNVGTAWTTKSPSGLTHSIVGDIENVELFDAKYENCLKISFETENNVKTNRTNDVKGTSFYAKDIGLVRTIYKINGITIDITLQKYDK